MINLQQATAINRIQLLLNELYRLDLRATTPEERTAIAVIRKVIKQDAIVNNLEVHELESENA
jgi:hypothetical protein